MKGFPFKRHLILLVTCLLAIGVIVPIATFAKSASGEPHHPTPSIKHVTQTASGDATFNVTTDADCHVGTDTVVSFHTGDVVSGTATLVTTQGDPAEEAGEHEDLFLQGTNVPSIPSIAVDSGSHSFSFTAAGDGTLTACVGGSDGGDGDESGTITGTVTPPSTQPPPIIKTIPISGPISAIKDKVNKVLQNLGVRLAIACTVGILANKVKLIALGKIDFTLIKLDFTLASQPELLDKEISIVEALLDLVPGFGCAKAIVNLLSGGGIDELHNCLHDAGCRHQIATDPEVKRNLCIAVAFALEGTFPVGFFPFLSFESKFLCG